MNNHCASFEMFLVDMIPYDVHVKIYNFRALEECFENT